MKLLDRYLLRCYAGPLAACLAAFSMLYVVADLFNNLSDFIEGQTSAWRVAMFYAALLPTGLVYIVPASLLLALLYCLGQLTKNNELTAMRACGVSTPRLLLPFIATGLAATLAVGLINETVSPWAAWWTRRFVCAQRAEDPASIYVETHLPYRNHTARREWLIGRFDTRTGEMSDIKVEQYHPTDYRILYSLKADSAHWMDGRWWFRNVVYQEYDEYNDLKGPPRFEAVREMSDWDETPRLFLEEIRDRDFRSVAGLLRFLRNNRGISRAETARTWVDIHHRISLPFTCLIVTMIGLPFGYQTGRRGAMRGTLLALGLFFSYYVLIHLGLWAGKNRWMDAWLAGWLPNILFFGLSLRWIARMR